jgi:hypothetical protein
MLEKRSLDADANKSHQRALQEEQAIQEAYARKLRDDKELNKQVWLAAAEERTKEKKRVRQSV